MQKPELLKKLAQQSNTSQTEALNVLDALKDIIREGLDTTGEITIYGLAHFSLVHRAEKQGRNPQTGQPLTIAAKTVVKVKARHPLTLSGQLL